MLQGTWRGVTQNRITSLTSSVPLCQCRKPTAWYDLRVFFKGFTIQNAGKLVFQTGPGQWIMTIFPYPTVSPSLPCNLMIWYGGFQTRATRPSWAVESLKVCRITTCWRCSSTACHNLCVCVRVIFGRWCCCMDVRILIHVFWKCWTYSGIAVLQKWHSRVLKIRRHQWSRGFQKWCSECWNGTCIKSW